MQILVATSEFFDSDPRTVLLIESLLKCEWHIGVLQVQALRPTIAKTFDHIHGTILEVESINELQIYKTWTSRSVASKNLTTRLSSQESSFSTFLDSLNSDSFNATETFLINQFCLAFESLRSLLISAEGQEISLIVAEDLQSAFAGILLSEEFGLSVCYDAHELFAEASRFSGAEVTAEFIDVLRVTEQEVWRKSNLIATVSPGLAQHISDHAENRVVLSVPNFSSIESQVLPAKHQRTDQPRYVYFGGVAPFRNVDVLVKNWPYTKNAPTLSLYMPDSEWSRKVELTARRNQNIQICKPVPPSKLIREMSQYDAGIIPYSYPAPYDWSSPNKFGEYIAAALPIVAHPQAFTSQLIHKYGLGVICDISTSSELQETLEKLDLERLAVLSDAAAKAFLSDLNWNRVSIPLMEEINGMISTRRPFKRRENSMKKSEYDNVKFFDICIDLTIELLRPVLKKIWQQIHRLGLSRLIPNRFFKRIT